ncbi:MAG: archease [Acidimicrobiia bacterium]|nr:archease [Acidimicrobiia bacterium]
MPQPQGHRTLPHTADVIVEAWAPDFATCCAEAVQGLLGLCVDGSTAQPSGRHAFVVAGAEAEIVLLGVLDEVIFVLDTMPDVPVRANAGKRESGELDMELHLASRASVEWIGSTPKAVSRSELTVEESPGRVRCTFLVDV